jgi:hypothetical protein
MNPEVIKIHANDPEPAFLIQEHLNDAGVPGADFDLPHTHVLRFLHGAPDKRSSYSTILMRFIYRDIHDFHHVRPGWRHQQRADDFVIAHAHNTDAFIPIRMEHLVRRVRKMQ